MYKSEKKGENIITISQVKVLYICFDLLEWNTFLVNKIVEILYPNWRKIVDLRKQHISNKHLFNLINNFQTKYLINAENLYDYIE